MPGFKCGHSDPPPPLADRPSFPVAVPMDTAWNQKAEALLPNVLEVIGAGRARAAPRGNGRRELVLFYLDAPLLPSLQTAQSVAHPFTSVRRSLHVCAPPPPAPQKKGGVKIRPVC